MGASISSISGSAPAPPPKAATPSEEAPDAAKSLEHPILTDLKGVGAPSKEQTDAAKPPTHPILTELWRTVPTVLVWATFSFSLSYYNSWILNRAQDRFPFPFFYTLWNMIFQAVGMQTLFWIRPEWPRPSMAQLKQQWLLLLSMGVVTAVSIGGENSALVVVSLTVHESAKSAVPVLTMVLAWLLEGRYYTPLLFVVVIGLALCTALVGTGSIIQDTEANSVTGILLTVMAVLASSARPVVFALLLIEPPAQHGALTSPLVVVWYESILTTPLYLIAWLSSAEREALPEHMSVHAAADVQYILYGSLMAVVYSVAIIEIIHLTSSLTSTVLGTGKHVLMTLISAIFVDRVFDVSRHGGNGSHTGMIISGLVLYVPFTLGYAYLMLTNRAYEPWSYLAGLREAFCNSLVLCTTRENAAAHESSSLLRLWRDKSEC